MTDRDDPIRKLGRAKHKRDAADAAYKAAVLEAVEQLEAAGVRDAYARVAAASGMSRQSVRELVLRMRGEWS